MTRDERIKELRDSILKNTQELNDLLAEQLCESKSNFIDKVFKQKDLLNYVCVYKVKGGNVYFYSIFQFGKEDDSDISFGLDYEGIVSFEQDYEEVSLEEFNNFAAYIIERIQDAINKINDNYMQDKINV